VTRKYQSLSYHVVLQEVGALYQTIYLVAETLGLAVSALGAGNSDRFAKSFDTDFFAESSVGEMIVGGAPPT
jgi:SagB-type dehydrogenase family enzyme